MKPARRLAFLFALAAASCAGDPIDAPGQAADQMGVSSSQLGTAMSCPTYPGLVELSRACMVDSNGKTYPEDGTLFVFPAAPPYGAMFVFKAGFAPLAADVTSEGGAPSVGVYAAPYDVASSMQCCSEDSPANRIPASTVLDETGTLTIAVTSPVPVGTQIAIILDYGRLYRGRIAPAAGGPCDLPSQEFCGYASQMGFAMRFYVGSSPSAVATPAVTDPTSPPDGACLLAYNTALADGDPCCYREGGANTCDTGVRCNERSGGGCCLIYGTENTSDGQRCCLYANGGAVDGADECARLLAAP